MIKTIKEAKQIAKKYNAIKTDEERLAFLKEQKGNLKVVLDNDCTMVAFDVEEDNDIWESLYDIELNNFDNFHGWEDGVIELFEFAGITAEGC